MKGTRIVGAAAVAAALLLGACRDPGGAFPGGPPPDSPTGSTPSDPVVEEPGPIRVRVRDGLVDLRLTDWHAVDVVDERTVVVQFYGGVEECYGVGRVDVDYGPEAVTVSVYQGRVPTAEVCIEIAVLKALEVRLDEPLGGREVLDGAEAK